MKSRGSREHYCDCRVLKFDTVMKCLSSRLRKAINSNFLLCCKMDNHLPLYKWCRHCFRKPGSRNSPRLIYLEDYALVNCNHDPQTPGE